MQLVLSNQLSPLLDAGYVEEALRQHFEPLLDSTFDEILGRHYRVRITFDVDGRELATAVPAAVRVPISIRLGRRRTPSVVGFLERHHGLGPDREGIAISTFGKVIKRGWDWLGVAPAARGQVTGLAEAPDLAACLTLSKSDFIRTGARGASYLAYRKAIQEVVSRQLAQWGDGRDVEARPRIVRLERDLERVLEDLSDDFPLLRSLVDRRSGGQKRLPMPGRGAEQVAAPLFAETLGGDDGLDGSTEAKPPSENGGPDDADRPSSEVLPTPPESTPESDRDRGSAIGDGPTPTEIAAGTLQTTSGRRRPARYGLLVQFESRPEDSELARLVDSTVWINDAHPAFVRASASRSLGCHTALSVALALAPLAVEAEHEHAFITHFLAHWAGRSRRSGGGESGAAGSGRAKSAQLALRPSEFRWMRPAVEAA